MTNQEVSERYQIPMEILREYESWDLCGSVQQGQYSGLDLERLSLILTFREIGFSTDQVEAYMRLTQTRGGGGTARLRLLEEKRRSTMDEIHCLEKRVAHMDYLRNQIKTGHKSR